MTDQTQLGFRALADPTRREILVLLAQGDRTIGEVAENFDMTRAAVRKHLTILGEGGLVAVERRGRAMINRLETAGLEPVADWFGLLEGYWDDRLNALKTAIEKDMQ